MRKSLIAILLAAATLTGCQSANHKTPTEKEQASREWDEARSSVLLGLAKEQYQDGNLDKCKQTVDEALAMNPKGAPLHVMAAKVAIEQGQMELAENELKLARQYDGKLADAYYLSGVVYQRWQKPEVAFDFYTRASELAPEDLSYLLARSEMLVAMNRSDEALVMLQDKVDYFEHSATIRDAVGQLLVQKGKYDQAIPVLQEAAILSNDDPNVREHLGLAMYCGKQYAAAVDVLTRLLNDEHYQSRGDLYLALGECQMQLNKAHEAREAFESAAQIQPGVPIVWLSLAKAAMEEGDLYRADASIRRAISLDNTSSDAQLLLGYLRLKQNHFDEALAAFTRCSEIDPQDSVSLSMQALVLEKMGKHELASKVLGQALKLNPNDELANRLMAEIDLRD